MILSLTHPPQPIPLPPTATICLNPSLSSRYQNVNTACFALLFSCPVQEANMEERGSRLGMDGFHALQSSLEHVLKSLTRQNILTELTLDCLAWNHLTCFFLEQLPLLTTHVPECLVKLKVVRNSFPFSIPTELYERLTRL